MAFIPKAAVQKAVDAGWPNKIGYDFFEDSHPEEPYMLFDPSFWKALSAACDWPAKENPNRPTWTYHDRGLHVVLLDEWENAMHTCIDLVLNRRDLEDFWQEMLK